MGDRIKLRLSKRLSLVASMVPEGASLVDVGTDHGYVPVHLILENKISRAMATDIHNAPLESARHAAAEYGVLDRLELFLCDGLKGISNHQEIDTVIIAGMGGETICRILTDAPWTNSADVLLILQPMSKQYELRKYLVAQGYEIQWEGLSGDGDKIYNILTVRGGGCQNLKSYAPGELFAGRINKDDDPELFSRYIAGIEKKIKHALDGISRSEAESDRQRAEELSLILDDLKKLTGDKI